MKTTALFCLLLLLVADAYGNIALPVQPPPPSGDLIPSGQIYSALRIEREELFLNCLETRDAFSIARYAIRNTAGRDLAVELSFITPFMEEVTVTVDGRVVALAPVTISRDNLPWKPPVEEKGVWPEEIKTYRFLVVFPGSSLTEVAVRFRLPAGFDNRGGEHGMFPAEAGHALNWGKGSARTAWYLYNLASASTFTGGIASLEVSILVPENAELKMNVALDRGETGDGGVIYHGSFSGIPAPFIEAKLAYRVSFNAIGGTFGIGLITDYAGYTEFMTQALFDLYFYNHQFSAGIEGNPFGTSFKLPLVYTFIPGGSVSAYAAFLGDIRFSGGVLFDLLPEADTGFRVSLGLRLTLQILEITYDFYPLDPARGYRGRMTFLYKFSI